jgi:hypothetical protein
VHPAMRGREREREEEEEGAAGEEARDAVDEV